MATKIRENGLICWSFEKRRTFSRVIGPLLLCTDGLFAVYKSAVLVMNESLETQLE